MTPILGPTFLASSLFFLAMLQAPSTSVRAAAAKWDNQPLEAVLDKSATSKSTIVVKVDAAWCPGCRNLDREVFGSDEATKVLRGRRAVRVDFDKGVNRGVIERYAILGLPTVLLLTPSGDEIGRVVGYPGKKKWLEQFEAVANSGDGLTKLESRYKSKDDDPALILKLGKTLLNRGLRKRAIALLETLSWLPQATDVQKAESLFVLGRYFHRVRRQPDVARHVWRELASRYPSSPYAAGAWWWYARAQAELGRPEVGETALKSRFSETGKVRHGMAWGKYVLKHKRSSGCTEAANALAKLKVEGTLSADLAALISDLKRLSSAK